MVRQARIWFASETPHIRWRRLGANGKIMRLRTALLTSGESLIRNRRFNQARWLMAMTQVAAVCWAPKRPLLAKGDMYNGVLR